MRNVKTATRNASLWLTPEPSTVVVDLARFANYPYFFDVLEEYGARTEGLVEVRWQPFKDFDDPAVLSDNEEEAENEQEFIDYVASRMRAGVDVPPLVRWGGEHFDGRHRASAARQLGIRRAPTIDLEDLL